MVHRLLATVVGVILALNILHGILLNSTSQPGHQADEDVGSSNQRLPSSSPASISSRCASAPDASHCTQEELMQLEASEKVRKGMVLEHWLDKNGWIRLAKPLQEIGVGSLADLATVDLNLAPRKLRDDLVDAQEYLPEDEEGVEALERLVALQLEDLRATKDGKGEDGARGRHQEREDSSSGALSKLMTLLVTVATVWLVWDLGLTPTEVIWGAPLHKSFTRLEWPDLKASHTKTIAVSFYDVKGQPVDVTDSAAAEATGSSSSPALRAEVWHQHRRVNAFVSAAQPGEPNVVHLVFASRAAGRYYISLKCGQHLVRGFPTLAVVEPGPVDPRATVLLGTRSSTLVLTSGVPDTVQIDPRDAFGNTLPKKKLPTLASRFGMQLVEKLGEPKEAKGAFSDAATFLVYSTPIMDTLCASVAFSQGQEGWYRAVVTLDGEAIGRGAATEVESGAPLSTSASEHQHLTLIVLSRHERSKVNRYLEGGHDNLPSFEAELVAEAGLLLPKPKTVWCFVTPKQVTIKDYFLRFIPRKLYTFRLVPSTKLMLSRYSGPDRTPVVCFEDGFQGSPEILTQSGNILASCFYLMLLHKMGGSETFRDKQTFFNAKLLKHHQAKGHKHTRMSLKVDRFDILGSSMRATKWFSESDWCKLFEVEFDGEHGIDQGGVRREWFEVLCKKLFHPSTGLFVSMEDSSEAVFPNPNPGPDVKSKMYRFAGRVVGKCLYESAHGVTYRQHLPARLAKSFLAQIVGLRVHYKHFADDAPELYSSKVTFIKDNPVADLDLNFSEEEFGEGGVLLRTVDLKPGGSLVRVTDDNKLEYLDLLAQRRLCSRVRDQTEQFLSGLHQFVPDSLLSLFDESELELMLCGVREYSVGELRRHHDVVLGTSGRSQQWFWAALASFTPEQFARLLQFATGSSQLPPGGFSELKPRFQIAPSDSGPDSLPTAHTCFNMICLPEKASFKEFEKSLLTAIEEGSEGFGFA